MVNISTISQLCCNTMAWHVCARPMAASPLGRGEKRVGDQLRLALASFKAKPMKSSPTQPVPIAAKRWRRVKKLAR